LDIGFPDGRDRRDDCGEHGEIGGGGGMLTIQGADRVTEDETCTLLDCGGQRWRVSEDDLTSIGRRQSLDRRLSEPGVTFGLDRLVFANLPDFARNVAQTTPQTQPAPEPAAPPAPPTKEERLALVPSPKNLVAHLDQHIVGQEVAKRRLARGVSNPLKRVGDDRIKVETAMDRGALTLSSPDQQPNPPID
jgi:hypothetical protein